MRGSGVTWIRTRLTGIAILTKLLMHGFEHPSPRPAPRILPGGACQLAGRRTTHIYVGAAFGGVDGGGEAQQDGVVRAEEPLLPPPSRPLALSLRSAGRAAPRFAPGLGPRGWARAANSEWRCWDTLRSGAGRRAARFFK